MTENDLATLALQFIGVIDADETPDASELAFVKGHLERALASLETYDLQVWDISNTPNAYVSAFLAYAIPLFSGTFGQPVPNILMAQKAALAGLKDVISPRRANANPRPDYF